MKSGLFVATTAIMITVFVSSIDLSSYAQGRQVYPRINEEEWVEVKPGERYNCPTCEMIFQDTEFTVWEYADGNRVVVAVPITDNATLQNEGFAYNYCFTGIQHAIEGLCDNDYEKYGTE